MNCADWQLRIAAESEDAAVAEHAAGCADCREFAHELAENQRALRTLAVDEAAVSALRARVMAEVGARRWRFAWWWAAPSAAALASIAAVVAVWPSAPDPAPPPAVVYAPRPPDVPVPIERREPAVVRVRRPVVARAAKPAQALRMEIETSDPNVKIIWLVDAKGDSL